LWDVAVTNVSEDAGASIFRVKEPSMEKLFISLSVSLQVIPILGLLSCPEDGDSKFVQNVGNRLHGVTAMRI
jgi:hypothetical protein